MSLPFVSLTGLLWCSTIIALYCSKICSKIFRSFLFEFESIRILRKQKSLLINSNFENASNNGSYQ